MQFEDLTLDQFNTKAQAELMSKDGPDITMLLDGLFDYQKGRTNLLEEETVQLLEKWYTALEMKAERKEEHIRINDDAMFTEYDDCIFEFMDSYRLRIQYSIGHFLT